MPRRPDRPGLTPLSIAEAGRHVIERDGLDALSMRAVAAELDTAASSLYRHVADREALLLAILEQVATGLPVRVPGRDPVARLRRRWRLAHDYMAEHSWVPHVLIRGELVAENAFPFSDSCVDDFMKAGLTAARAMQAFTACWQLTLGELLSAHPLHAPREPTQRQEAAAGVDPDRLPALAAGFAALRRGIVGDAYDAAIGPLIAVLVADGNKSARTAADSPQRMKRST